MLVRQAPKNWCKFHHQECGTLYRGCSPKCPKHIYELTGNWVGPAWPLAGEVRSLPSPGSQGAFGAIRKHDVHTGIDLYCPSGTHVYSVSFGVVLDIMDFTGPDSDPPSPWWNPTRAILIMGDKYVYLYGEVSPHSDLTLGQAVTPGQSIGRVATVLKKDKGRPMSMLHFEMYEKDVKNKLAVVWALGEPKPKGLIDPTPFITGLLSCPEEGLDELKWLARMIELEEERGEFPYGGAAGGPPRREKS